MIDPLAFGASALSAALGKRAATVAEWLLLHAVGLGAMTLIIALLLLNAQPTGYAVVVLDPAAAASYVLHMIGVTDQAWLDAFVSWVRRPELAWPAWAASAFAGVALLRWSGHGTEIAWIVLILTTIAVGPGALFTAGITLVVVVTILCIPATIELFAGPRSEYRGWFDPSFVLQQGLRAVIEFLITPLIPVFRMINGITAQFTYDITDRRQPPTGAVTARTM